MADILHFDIYLFSGMYEFSKTGQLLPILVGTTMHDPQGTGQEVPILGAEKSAKTRNIVPLGGTMEDPEGGGLYYVLRVSNLC